MDVFEWIEQELRPERCSSTQLIYDKMISQSNRRLPLIYVPFDAGNRSHWRDRGSLFDFLHVAGHGRLLDFGPGDGWPSLIVAPFVDEVVGVEGSRLRLEVCRANAQRLDLTNASFTMSVDSTSLPFPDGSFAGIMAASSLEQTDDPRATLRELFRVLKTGGRLRLAYEALGRYGEDRRHDLWMMPEGQDKTHLILYDRHLRSEAVDMYGMTISLPFEQVNSLLSSDDQPVSFAQITIDRLGQLKDSLLATLQCTLTHPSGATLISWGKEIGFKEVLPTHDGAGAAGALFDRLDPEERPATMAGVDRLLRPIVDVIVELEASVLSDPMLTFVK